MCPCRRSGFWRFVVRGNSERLNHPSNTAATIKKGFRGFQHQLLGQEQTDEHWELKVDPEAASLTKHGGVALVRHNKLIKDVTAHSGPVCNFSYFFNLRTVIVWEEKPRSPLNCFHLYETTSIVSCNFSFWRPAYILNAKFNWFIFWKFP